MVIVTSEGQDAFARNDLEPASVSLEPSRTPHRCPHRQRAIGDQQLAPVTGTALDIATLLFAQAVFQERRLA